MPPAIPACLAFIPKSFLHATQTLPSEVRDQVFERVPTRVAHEIETVPRVAWISLELHRQVLEAQRAVLGDKEFHALCRRSALSIAGDRYLKPVSEAAFRVLHIGPKEMLKWSRRVTDFTMRNVGEWVFEDTDRHNEYLLILSKIPVELFQTGTIGESIAGGFMSVLDLAQRNGTVSLETFDLKGRILRYRFRWEEPEKSLRK